MRKALEAIGVPGDKIVCDFAGFRTLDSVVRVKEVFRQNKVVFVSQGFHNERAVCLARHHDIDAHAFNAGGDAAGLAGLRNWLRERLARVRMVLDLYVFDTGPKYLGPPEPVPTQEPVPAKP
jgi:SanA protein